MTPTTLKIRKKNSNPRTTISTTKKDDTAMYDLLVKINGKLDNVEAKVDKLNEKINIKRIEDLEQAKKDNKYDVEILIAESSDLQEEVNKNIVVI